MGHTRMLRDEFEEDGSQYVTIANEKIFHVRVVQTTTRDVRGPRLYD